MQTRQWCVQEGDIVHRYTAEPNGRLTRERLSASRSAVIEQNQKLRNEGVVGQRDWGRTQLRIPENDYHRLLSQNPELKCWDKEIRTKAWDKFMRSDAAKPYLVREKA